MEELEEIVKLFVRTSILTGCSPSIIVSSLPKSALTDYVGALAPRKIAAINSALRIALDIPD